jgi:hypothetical protein
MSAARGSAAGLLIAIAFTGLAGEARANEPADRGISLSAWAGGALDRSVMTADGRPVHMEALVAGLTGVGNIERVAIGGAVDVRPNVLGEGRLALSAMLGYQQQIGRRRVLVLGEAGGRRFAVAAGEFEHQVGPEPWLPFVGVRLGSARMVPPRGFVELGSWLFARFDLERANVTTAGDMFGAETRTEYRVGGFMAGLALQLGLRLEAPHPWNQGVVEPRLARRVHPVGAWRHRSLSWSAISCARRRTGHVRRRRCPCAPRTRPGCF